MLLGACNLRNPKPSPGLDPGFLIAGFKRGTLTGCAYLCRKVWTRPGLCSRLGSGILPVQRYGEDSPKKFDQQKAPKTCESEALGAFGFKNTTTAN